MIFGLLGLAFLGGGAWAIVDGWPYLVLERGFTQVIIGSVVATAGTILIALSRVMVELRQVRASLVASGALSAAAALATASTAPAEAGKISWPSGRPTARVLPGPVPPEAGGLSPTAIGLAGAGAALAAAGALADPSPSGEDRPAGAAAPVPSGTEARHDEAGQEDAGQEDAGQQEAGQKEAGDESDTRWLAPELSTALNEQSFAPFPPRTSPVDVLPDEPDDLAPKAEPAMAGEAADRAPEPFDPVAAAIAAAIDEPKPLAPIAEPEPVSAPEPEPEARRELEQEPEPAGQSDDPFHVGDPAESSIWWPEINASAEFAVAPPEPEASEPASLRERLSIGPALPDLGAGRPSVELPKLPAEPDKPTSLDAAEAWMNPVFSRREPFFGEPSAQPVASEPPWPAPPVLPSLPLEPLEPAPAVRSEEPIATRPDEASAFEPLPESEPEAEAQVAAPVADAPPAASEEGVIGAYQVGEAHFTLFADGSIKARTPDGDYQFGSMDELKVYLASEKSRLGV
jgi:hypothetical protein